MAKIRIKGDTSGYIDIAAPAVAGTQTLTLPTSGSLLSSEDVLDSDQIGTGAVTAAKLDVGQIGGRRNLVINGAMQVAQRGTSGTFTDDGFHCDRWKGEVGNMDELSVAWARDSEAPDGFGQSLKLTISTPESSLAADEKFILNYNIEAQDCQSLAFGSASPNSITVSFYVRSSVTGTYPFSIYQGDGADIIGSTYTINSADTWERKTLTFAGNTLGAISNDTGTGLNLKWGLGLGSNLTSGDNTSWSSYSDSKVGYGQSNSLVTTSGATWYITGVQLEVGAVATPFEHRSYGEELMLCGRYYQKSGGSNQWLYPISSGNNGYRRATIKFIPQLRATPSMTTSFSGSGSGSGVQHTSNVHLDVYVDGISDTNYVSIQSWTADAEL